MFPVRKGKKNVGSRPLTQPPRMLVSRAREIQEELGKLKPLHEELDQITLALSEVPKLETYGVILKDKFSDKNTAWKATATRRFELVFDEATAKTDKIVSPEAPVEVLERLNSLIEKLEAKVVPHLKARRPISATKATAKPKKRPMTPKHKKQLANARENFFKKYGYGPYKQAEERQSA